jgi:hypothetical protein
MKNLLFTLGFSLYFNAVFGQQNLFNIPSGDITPENNFFYQHQFNFYEFYKFESKSHFVWGLGSGFDVGINVINKKFDLSKRKGYFVQNEYINGSALSPLALLTLQKQFKINQNIKLNIGTQIGSNFKTAWHKKKLAYFNYAVTQIELPYHIKLMGGGYTSNDAFLGVGQNVGVLLGYEIPLSKRWYLMGDYISGNHSNGVSVIGAMYNASKRLQICVGALISNRNNAQFQADFGNRFVDGIVLEINVLGWDYW